MLPINNERIKFEYINVHKMINTRNLVSPCGKVIIIRMQIHII